MIEKSEHIGLFDYKHLDHTITPEGYNWLFDYLKDSENLDLLKPELNWHGNLVKTIKDLPHFSGRKSKWISGSAMPWSIKKR